MAWLGYGDGHDGVPNTDEGSEDQFILHPPG